MATQNEQIVQDIIKLLDARGFTDAKITAQSNFFDDIDMDSLDYVEIVMDVERKFSVTVSDDPDERFDTVGGMAAYVESMLEARGKSFS